jgi:hypothetical protein
MGQAQILREQQGKGMRKTEATAGERSPLRLLR